MRSIQHVKYKRHTLHVNPVTVLIMQQLGCSCGRTPRPSLHTRCWWARHPMQGWDHSQAIVNGALHKSPAVPRSPHPAACRTAPQPAVHGHSRQAGRRQQPSACGDMDKQAVQLHTAAQTLCGGAPRRRRVSCCRQHTDPLLCSAKASSPAAPASPHDRLQLLAASTPPNCWSTRIILSPAQTPLPAQLPTACDIAAVTSPLLLGRSHRCQPPPATAAPPPAAAAAAAPAPAAAARASPGWAQSTRAASPRPPSAAAGGRSAAARSAAPAPLAR